MCLHGVFVLQGKSQVLVSGETSSVASISEPLPLCSLSALTASFSLSCALTWSGRHQAACQIKRSKQQPGVLKSLMCARLKISLRTQVTGSTSQPGRAQNSGPKSFLATLWWQTAKTNVLFFDLEPSCPVDVFQYPFSNTSEVTGWNYLFHIKIRWPDLLFNQWHHWQYETHPNIMFI